MCKMTFKKALVDVPIPVLYSTCSTHTDLEKILFFIFLFCLLYPSRGCPCQFDTSFQNALHQILLQFFFFSFSFFGHLVHCWGCGVGVGCLSLQVMHLMEMGAR